MYRDLLPTWVSKHARILLLGDAAHPFLADERAGGDAGDGGWGRRLTRVSGARREGGVRGCREGAPGAGVAFRFSRGYMWLKVCSYMNACVWYKDGRGDARAGGTRRTGRRWSRPRRAFQSRSRNWGYPEHEPCRSTPTKTLTPFSSASTSPRRFASTARRCCPPGASAPVAV